MLHEGLRDKERAFQVDVQHGVVILLADVPKFLMLFDAGVVDENIDTAEARDAFVDKALAVREFGDIALEGNAFASRALQRRQNFIGARLIGALAQRDVSAVASKPLHDSASNALAAAG